MSLDSAGRKALNYKPDAFSDMFTVFIKKKKHIQVLSCRTVECASGEAAVVEVWCLVINIQTDIQYLCVRETLDFSSTNL